jgi:hypothetical protein
VGAAGGSGPAAAAPGWPEFLQLVWQAVGLALLFFWGSLQSKESDERVEATLDRLLEERGIDPQDVTRRVNQSL